MSGSHHVVSSRRGWDSAYLRQAGWYADNHVKPPGFDDAQAEWDRLKADAVELDRSSLTTMNDAFDIVYDHVQDAEWLCDVRVRMQTAAVVRRRGYYVNTPGSGGPKSLPSSLLTR